MLFAFLSGINTTFPDSIGYLSMAESLGEGKFSSWYFLDKYYPETLRTPGYPFFLFILKCIYDSELFIKIVQLIIGFCSLIIAVKALKRITSNKITLLIFLALSSLNIQLYYYSGLIASDCLSIFFTILYIYIILDPNKNFTNSIFLGLTAAIAFQIRPAFLLIPFAVFVLSLFKRRYFYYSSIHLLLFVVLLLPFGFWNKKNHGVFKITPIEGGAGVAHIGLWKFKLPDGYKDNFYWEYIIINDFTQPSFVSSEEKQQNIDKIREEWQDINLKLAPFETKEDLYYLKKMKQTGINMFVLHNSEYTIKREKILWAKTFEHIYNEPIFYLKTRVYSMARLYFTGLDIEALRNEKSTARKIKILYPFGITFCTIFLGLFFTIGMVLYQKFRAPNSILFILMVAVYYGFSHSIFVIQARYTVPVHFLILIGTSYFLGHIMGNRIHPQLFTKDRIS